MRRKDREVENFDEILEIINQCDVMRVAFVDNNKPYIVPMNFGKALDEYNNLILYFHCAKAGKKLDLIKLNNNVCVEADHTIKIESGEMACDWTCRYESVIGQGIIEIVSDENEKFIAMSSIMKKYGFTGNMEFDKNIFSRTVILKVLVSEISGKRNH